MILNTLDHLGKFNAKGDEGYFIGYSLSSKAFRVFNKRTKKIEENLHVDFLENRSIEKGTGPDWYKKDVHQAVKEKESPLRFITLPNWFHEAQMATLNAAATKDDAIPDNNAPQKEQKEVNGDKDVPESSGNSNPTAISLNDMEADLSNMETAIQVSLTPTLRIHKDHPKNQIIGPVDTPVQTRQKTKNVDEQSFIAIIYQKTNLDLLQYCLFSCFLSQEEPKKIVDALKDLSWVEAMQQELLQFKIQNEKRIDYEEVSAPVAKIEAIRLFLAYASYMGFTVYQMDVKSTFLYGSIDEEGESLGKDRTGKDVELHLYRSMIRSLMYLTTSRPNIMFADCACARHQVTPKECHLHAVKRIFRYLKGHPKLGLWYPEESPFDLVAYSDSDYGGANQDRKSTIEGWDKGTSRIRVFIEYSWPVLDCPHWDPVVNICLHFLHGLDSKKWTHEFMHIHLVSASVCVCMDRLAFCDYHNMVDILEKTEHNTEFHQIVDFLEASHIRQRTVSKSSIMRHLKLNDEEGISTLPDNELFENLSLMGYNILPNQRFSFQKGQFSHQWKFLIHTIMQCLSPKSTSFNEFSSNIAIALVCLATNRTYNFSKMIFDGMMRNVKNETAFPTGNARYGEAFPTVLSLDAGQDRENIAKTFAIPHKASTRVTSLSGGEGRMDQGEDLLVGYTVKDSDNNADKGSNSTYEMDNVLGTLGVANILSNEGLRSVFTTSSLSVATASTVVSPAIATVSGSFPTAAIFTTASVATSTTRVTRSSRGVVIESSSPIYVNIPSISKKDKGKGKMTEPEQLSKEKVLEQMSAQLARDLEAKFAQEDQIIREQAERDSEIARIHAKRELEMMITELDKNNKMVVKYLSEYERTEAGLSHDEKVELIDELLMYQSKLAQIKKYQAQQNKPATKTERRNFYMSILRSNAGWKVKDFKGMTFEQIKEKFIPIWEKMQDFVPMNSKLESERFKRPEIQLGKESFKKLKTTEASGTKPTQEQQSEEPKEISDSILCYDKDVRRVDWSDKVGQEIRFRG
nr:hypothetical protein [Tanacetum cinerariifolium]